MASEVTKYSVFDPRIIQTKPKYAVEKGALSLTNVPFQAQTWDSSSVQFNVQVPSENVFVDRAVEWRATQVARVRVRLTATGGAVPALASLQGLIAPGAFPLHQSVSQMSSTINDATVTVNTRDVLSQVLRLADVADARRQRTCPTMLDRYALQPDTRVVPNSPLRQWSETHATDEVPNGGFGGFYYCANATGAPIANDGTVAVPTVPTAAGDNVVYIRGQPCLAAALDDAAVRDLVFYVAYRSVEKLLLPPFIFADQEELSTGLFGVQNFQVQMNLSPDASRSIRVSLGLSLLTAAGAPTGVFSQTLVDDVPQVLVDWSSTAGGGTNRMFYEQPSLNVQFLSPSLDVPLPPKSIVPYMEFPRYISTPANAIGVTPLKSSPGTTVMSNTITLPNIPDYLVIYARPAAYDASQGDWSLPITSISLNFDNFSGLLSTMTQEQLYQMSVHNGVDMDWSSWSGFGVVPSSSGAGATRGGWTGLVGGPLVLRPGRDFALQAGQAPGLVGNFTLQYNLTLQNFTGAERTPLIYTVPISSGFFETIKGSSRIIKGVLTEQDILSAPAHSPEEGLERSVGAGRRGGAMAMAPKPMGKTYYGPVGGRSRGSMAAYM
jgi:hypothetical protein